MKKSILFFFLMVMIAACSPKISYMGDSYGPTFNVDVYYDQGDIKQEYRVMGIARNEGDVFETDDLNSIKEQLIKKAREVGADAILIVSVGQNTSSGEDDYDPNKIVEAKFIKYGG